MIRNRIAELVQKSAGSQLVGHYVSSLALRLGRASYTFVEKHLRLLGVHQVHLVHESGSTLLVDIGEQREHEFTLWPTICREYERWETLDVEVPFVAPAPVDLKPADPTAS